MQLKIVEWELDNLEVKTLPELSEGEHTLYIEEMTRKAVIRALKQGMPHIV